MRVPSYRLKACFQAEGKIPEHSKLLGLPSSERSGVNLDADRFIKALMNEFSITGIIRS